MFIYYKHQFFFEGIYTNLMVLQLHWFLKLGNEIEPAAVQIGKKRKKPELYSDVRLTGPVSGDCGDRPCTELVCYFID